MKTLSSEATPRIATPTWWRLQKLSVELLRQARQEDDAADTNLLIPASQHPLLGGELPNREFEIRLQAAHERYQRITEQGGKAKFFLAGNRHHDAASEQTDKVALYDAAGLWLTDNGVPPTDLHGKDWVDSFQKPIYSGAAEIAVAAQGFQRHLEFSDATYFCSQGQRGRAHVYALAHNIPLDIVIPPALADGTQVGQFHQPGLRSFVLDALTRTIDPYGEVILAHATKDRVPADGNMGTIPELLPQYAHLPWYKNTEGTTRADLA
jgi:hypothetical protein